MIKVMRHSNLKKCVHSVFVMCKFFENVEFGAEQNKLGLFLVKKGDRGYGNTGCGVFNRGVQN